ncbi:hypothetical protein KUTeg_004877 [Tegillarca granosa]|uniref:Poly [ADP-ribose] polymerase n=1 Tax=Tegillarca granosa TaxID=220873 RepID=A0ABQ9FI53_TEGGR|nr:hypothetical protein KUTeg_004877 [Tegillarca granosa]
MVDIMEDHEIERSLAYLMCKSCILFADLPDSIENRLLCENLHAKNAVILPSSNGDPRDNKWLVQFSSPDEAERFRQKSTAVIQIGGTDISVKVHKPIPCDIPPQWLEAQHEGDDSPGYEFGATTPDSATKHWGAAQDFTTNPGATAQDFTTNPGATGPDFTTNPGATAQDYPTRIPLPPGYYPYPRYPYPFMVYYPYDTGQYPKPSDGAAFGRGSPPPYNGAQVGLVPQPYGISDLHLARDSILPVAERWTVSKGSTKGNKNKKKTTTVIKVSELPEGVTEDALTLFFENRRKFGGGSIESCSFDETNTTAFITFEEAEAVDRVLQKLPVLFMDKKIEVSAYFSDSNENSEDEEGGEIEGEVTPTLNKVEVRGVKQGTTDDTVLYYFENKKRSGGGDIQNMEREDNVIYITFEDEDVIERVMEKEHKIDGALLQVSRYIPAPPPKPIPTYTDKFFISGLNPDTTRDCLLLFIEARVKHCPTGIIYGEQEGTALITFEEEAPELEKLESVFAKNCLDGNTLSVSKVPVTNTIMVTGISNTTSSDTVRFYFENTRRSGGGEVEDVHFERQEGTCFVSFKDPESKPESLELLKSQKWTNKKTEIEKKFPDLVHLVPCLNQQQIVILSVAENVGHVRELVDDFINLYTVLTEVLPLPPGKLRYLQEYHKKDFEALSYKFKDEQGQAKVIDGKIQMKGTRQSIKHVKKDVQDILDKVEHRQHLFKKPGIVKYIQSEQGKDKIRMVEKTQRCVIETNEDEKVEMNSEDEAEFKDDQQPRETEMGNVVINTGQRIFAVCGDITELKGIDVIVNAANKKLDHMGGLAKVIVTKGATRSTGGRDKQQVDTGCNINIEVIEGLISKQDVDVIVNSTSRNLQLNNGAVSSSLLKAGGPGLQQECSNNYPNGIQPGDVAVTSGGRLNCQSVFHGSLKDWSTAGGSKSLEIFRGFINKCLVQADNNGYSTIAFPALGTGNLGFPRDIVAKEMFQCVTDFSIGHPRCNITEVRFVVYDKDIACVKAFRSEEKRWKSGGARQGRKFSSDTVAAANARGGQFVESGTEDIGESLLQIGSLKLRVYQGDITQAQTDAIVNTTNSDFELTREKPLKSDAIVVTAASPTMNCKFIIHLNAQDIDKKWKSPIIKLLEKSEELSCTSVALPALGTGYAKNNALSDVAEGFWEALLKVKDSLNKVKEVHMVIFDLDKLKNFVSEMHKHISMEVTKSPGIFKRIKGFLGLGDPHIKQREKAEEFKVLQPEVSSIILMIYANSQTSIEDAIEGIDKQCEKDFTTKMIEDEMIKEFTQAHVERIQNRMLYQQYLAKKKMMESQNTSGNQNENTLWHGTSAAAVDSINTYGFNRSYCGRNAVVYGNGVYFAVSSDYSARDQYAAPDHNGHKRIYQCKVLTGEYVQGSQGLRVPPQKAKYKKILQKSIAALAQPSPGSVAHYDSVVDDILNPGIYVIFNDTQAYPEYLITFN